MAFVVCLLSWGVLCVRRPDHAELGGGNGYGHSAKKAAAIMVDFLGASISLQSGDSLPR
jgi:hypothetical protein